AGSGRAHGVNQLLAANGYLRSHFLRLWFRSVRKIRCDKGDADSTRDLSFSSIRERVMAEVFCLRSDGMDLATTYIPATAGFAAQSGAVARVSKGVPEFRALPDGRATAPQVMPQQTVLRQTTPLDSTPSA